MVAAIDFVSEKVRDQQRDIIPPLAQARELDRNHVEPIVQVLTKSSFFDPLFQRLVGGRHHANVYMNGNVLTHAPDFPLLQNAQEPALEHRRHRADLIEKDGAPIGFLEQTLLIIDRAGERAAAMAKKLGLEQILRQGAAIDRNKRGKLAAAVEMQGASDQFLARAALAEDQDRAIRIGYPFDQLEYLLHRGGAADDLAELIFFLKLFSQVSRLGDGSVIRKRPLHAQSQLLHFKGLLQIIERAIFHRLDGGFDRPEPGNDDHYRRRVQFSGFLDHLQPVGTGLIEVKIGNH